MILKENSLHKKIKQIMVNILKEKYDEINIGLEMELQQNSKYTDKIFSLDFDNDGTNIIVMIEEDEINLNSEETRNENVYFWKSKVYRNEDVENVIDKFLDINDDDEKRFEIITEDDEQTGEYLIDFIQPENYNSSPLQQVNDLPVKFESIDSHDDFEKMKEMFLNNNWKDKYSLEHYIDLTLEEYKDEIEDGNQGISPFAVNSDIDKIREDTYVKEYKLKLFVSNFNLDDRINKIKDYFNKNEILREYINKYGITISNQYVENTKYENFAIEDDTSLKTNQGFSTQFELKTPYGFNLKDQITFFKQFIDNEKNGGIRKYDDTQTIKYFDKDGNEKEIKKVLENKLQLLPNDSCGLHVNISLNDDSDFLEEIDYVILLMLFNENKLKINTRGVDIKTDVEQQANVKDVLISEVQDYIFSDFKDKKEELINKITETKNEYNENNDFVIRALKDLSDNIVDSLTSVTKHKSFIIKDDRIEFRIMGGNYLHKPVQKYILELQQVVSQQYYKQENIKEFCHKRQIQIIIKEIEEHFQLDKMMRI